jgi:hypothetical protein
MIEADSLVRTSAALPSRAVPLVPDWFQLHRALLRETVAADEPHRLEKANELIRCVAQLFASRNTHW